MPMIFLTGGVRSGKSHLAAQLAAVDGAPVVFVATAAPTDGEMRQRIERHRAQRPASWHTVEEQVDIEKPLRAAPRAACVVIDCLNLWVSNMLLEGLNDLEVTERAAAAARMAGEREGRTIAVSNEVGSSIHPDNALGRRFIDLLGRVNVIWALASGEAKLVVAGRSIALDDPIQERAGLLG